MNLDLPSVTSIVKGAEDDARNLRSVGWELEADDFDIVQLGAPGETWEENASAIMHFAYRRIQEFPMPAHLLRLYVFVFTRKWEALSPKDPTP